MKVYLIDDDPLTLLLITAMLSGSEIECECSLKVSEGLRDTIRQYNPDVLIVDVQLTEGDSLEFLEGLKGESYFENIPIIMISSENELNKVVKYLRSGALDYISKPFEKESFIKKVRQAGLIGSLFKKYRTIDQGVGNNVVTP